MLIEFFRDIWSYSSKEAKYVYIAKKERDKFRFKFFELQDNTGNHVDEISWEIEEYLREHPNIELFFSVLPLSKKPEKGRGSEDYVKIGRVLWLDLDYKQPIENSDRTFLEEREDGRLYGIVKIEDKYFKIERPPVSEVIKEIESKLQVKPNYIIDSGTGYHVYFILDKELDKRKIKDILKRLVELFDNADKQAKDLVRMLRVPETINSKYGRKVRILYRNEGTIPAEELYAALAAKELEEKQKQETIEREKNIEGFRTLSFEEEKRIVDIIKKVYQPGYRQYIALFLSGWLAKAGINPLNAFNIIRMLHEETNDEDPLVLRASTVVYSYVKAGVDLKKYTNEIKKILGIDRDPYGLYSEIKKEEIAGYSGLRDVLESMKLPEEEIMNILGQIQEILKKPSPEKGTYIFELVDLDKKIYYIADLKKKRIVRATRTERGFRYKDIVAIVCPVYVVSYESPIETVRKFKVEFETEALNRGKITIGPDYVDAIAARLAKEGLVYKKRLIEEALPALLNACLKHGLGEVNTQIEKPGYYWIDNRLVIVDRKTLEERQPKTPDINRLRDALKLLNEIVEHWFEHAKDRVAIIFKWGAVAPFFYILKTWEREVRWLYLWGETNTGKTTLAVLVLKMWGLDDTTQSIPTVSGRKGGSTFGTEARISKCVSTSTYPIVVNETRGTFLKVEVAEMIKNIVQERIAREKYHKDEYIAEPSLAPVIFTSNYDLPEDKALRRRFIIIRFTKEDAIPEEKKERFKTEGVMTKANILEEIGNAIEHIVAKNPKEMLDGDILTIGERLLSKCYELAGIKVPDWVKIQYKEEEDRNLDEEIVEYVRANLLKEIHDIYVKQFGKAIHEIRDGEKIIVDYNETKKPGEIELEEKVKVLLEKGLLEQIGIIYKDGNVLLTTVFAKTVAKDMWDLVTLGYVLFRKKPDRYKTSDKKTRYGILVPYSDFIDFLKG